MPIVNHPRLSETVITKVLRSVVTLEPDGWHVWDPATDSRHIVNPQCDCAGKAIRGTCSHEIAVAMHLQRDAGASVEQIVELLRKL